MEYKIAYGYSSKSSGACLYNLEKQVNDLIALGFKPFGSLQFDCKEKSWIYRAIQAMIKED